MNGTSRRQQRPTRKKHHWILWTLLGVLVVLLLAGGGFAYSILHKTQASFDKMYSPATTKAPQAIEQGKPVSILFLGVDTGADGRVDRGNSDTLIVATLNPKTHKTMMYSIPRDTLAEMSGDKKRNMQKINAAYNIGSSTMAKKTVSRLLGIPIDYYVTVNMGGLQKVVDAVGGVTVNSPMVVSLNGITIPKGKQHLNGKQALTYARMRYEDPRGDYGRQMRQQEVIRAVMKKLASPKGISHYDALLKSLQPNVRTDLPFNNIIRLGLKYHKNADHISSQHLQGQSAWINGSSYQIASTSQLTKASNKMRAEMALPKKQLDNDETRLNALNPTFNGTSNQTYNTFGLDTVYYTYNTY
ncbi:LCP family protein [Loigolactobacillus backii]|uniref:LytR family transcriptional regulator n=1 Tax=Loigolactobacillus backii TaxID=375175 RepID=A0A192H0C3_9LACO|nr:LCP family protein [Loigolactobacillus backii]ANK60700.1 LytR family transcriptional regulator [Loigolactobacillus backii]ANK61733.1 LytR family transcriptional regulator [Loigolactobacillus backii]ANK65653.1 LytR family transcriptional regulator [Loigolactobacillus backii]ANK68130.1 LytR family transcriptional regulator [Loigolactobacillus backii]ANK69071.1 LytR family transcriptional regulator [Loigolactobacillus backii]